eukprot:6081193-Pyramimonas_sp.AAC.1
MLEVFVGPVRLGEVVQVGVVPVAVWHDKLARAARADHGRTPRTIATLKAPVAQNALGESRESRHLLHEVLEIVLIRHVPRAQNLHHWPIPERIGTVLPVLGHVAPEAAQPIMGDAGH